MARSRARSRTRWSAVAGVAVLSALAWAVLLLAAWQGWLGEASGRGAEFCEASGEGFVRQPANTLSNLGFTFAGLVIARWADTASRRPPLLATYAVVVALLGPASAAMHATETALGGHLDLLSMYLLASFTTAYAVVRRGLLDARAGGLLFVGLLVVCEVVGALPVTVPVFMHPGNVVFAALLVTTVSLEAAVVRAGGGELRWALAAVLTLVLAFVVWNLAKDGSPWCRPGSLLQGHGAWHLLDAVAAAFLGRHYLGTDSRRRPRE